MTSGDAARHQRDVDAIRVTASNYIEGWYTGDVARMRGSLHERAIKRQLLPERPHAAEQVRELPVPELLARVARNGQAPRLGRRDVDVLEVDGNVALARVRADDWVDWLQLARVNGEWRVVYASWRQDADRA